MYNGVALQSATSHYLGDNLPKYLILCILIAIIIRNMLIKLLGISTRIIGAIIMVHGDDNGLVLPPAIAPYKTVIIPIGVEEEVIEEAKKIENELKKYSISTILDLSDKTPGFKFAEYEMKGIPLRIEIGPKDIEQNNVSS